jgi:hypothetical protein
MNIEINHNESLVSDIKRWIDLKISRKVSVNDIKYVFGLFALKLSDIELTECEQYLMERI